MLKTYVELIQMTVHVVSARKRRCLREENLVHEVMWNCLVCGVGALTFRMMLCVWNL